MLCGTGVPGELCIGGGRVAAGYLARPALTAERFAADPFAGNDARMYRTGDRVRWTEDGALEFLGRLDAQVKIRGHRIEPGEVEAALRAHPAVRDCVAVAREDGGERRLVAYIVGSVDADALRIHLRERLPDYMVPSAFVAMDAIPLTPNGKVDWRRLPELDAAAAVDGDAYAEPRTRTERVLAELWAAALRLERVGIHDNFFALGGDSILSIQIIARAAQAGIRVTPRQMFVHQTIAELAPLATDAAPIEAEQGPVAGDVPLTPVQRWFFAQENPEPHWFNLALLFEVRGRLDPDVLQRAANALLAHHDALRMRYTRTAEGWTQHVAEPHTASVESIGLAAADGPARDAAFAEHAERIQRGLDLEAGPLIRFALFEMGDGSQRLLIAAHHLVVDAVSWRFLAADLESACRQAERMEEVALPPRTTSFKRWAERLADHARSQEARREADFWIAQAAAGDAPLPADHHGGSNTEGEADFVAAALDEAETRALLTDVPPVYGTQINDVLLAGLARAFGRWTGERALWVDVEGHGREELFDGVDVSRTAGWFTAIHPLRLEVPGEPGAALKAVKEQLRAVPAKGVGFGVLRWMGDDETRAALAALPVPRVSFNYLGQMDGAPTAAGDALLVPADGDAGPLRSPASPRTHLLSIDAAVMEGRLQVRWTYAPSVHDRATVERLAAGYVDALRELVAHCRDPQAGGYTPSDFALAGLDQEGLDALLSQLGR
jgi:non-ribosomal peptide synthase protein (TIGR01720 family)